jgi:signal transduction histidine kinase
MHSHLFNRLSSLPTLQNIPQQELKWLDKNGEYEAYDADTVIVHRGKSVEKMYIILSGKLGIRVDRGIGPKLVTEWATGEVSGLLPYSRMSSSPGNVYTEEKSEFLAINSILFSEMINKCPAFTALTVHTMLDRARNFNSSDLQEEKMVSLGKLASGLAHELNNPASTLMRNAKLLIECLPRLESFSRAIGATGLLDSQVEMFIRFKDYCLEQNNSQKLSPIEKADLHDKYTIWLENNNLDISLASTLIDSNLTLEDLDTLGQKFKGSVLNAGLSWLLINHTTHSMAKEMEKSALQIYQLVEAVRKFSYLDQRVDKEYVDVASGIRTTIRVMESKIKVKSARVKVKANKNLPAVYACGDDLNQIWLSLLDNALDAIGQGGKIDIQCCFEMNRVVTRIIDNGPGITKDIISRIFDPFFTTKPPGFGVGLGLDIARRLVRRYNGDINVNSRPGRTEFSVSLIIAPVAKN